MQDLVSIITPCYNAERFISQTIESVLSQTYERWELIIVDDVSTDNSKILVKKYMSIDTRIKLIELEINNGPANARNKGIEEANGKYVAFLDSDDLWLPDKLKKQILFLTENSLSMTYSSYYTIDEANNIINMRKGKEKISYNDMLKSNYIGNLTGIYDCEKIGKYFMDNINHEDYTLWLKIMSEIKETKGISEPLAKYRIVTSSVSANKFRVLSWQWHIYRHVIGLNRIKSLYYFIWYAYYAIKKRI